MWPGFNKHNAKPYIDRFRIVGADIIQEAKIQIHYKILQNNDYGLVAVWSISESQAHDHTYVGAEAIIIDKQTNEFKIVAITDTNHLPNHEPNSGPGVGSCIPN
jgi:hypothetical protein